MAGKISVHKFEGGGSVWCEIGDEKASTGILKSGFYAFGIASRSERITVIRGQGKINGCEVKWNGTKDNGGANVATIERGESINIQIDNDSGEMFYICDYGPKIFDPMFSQTLSEWGLSEKVVQLYAAVGITTVRGLVERYVSDIITGKDEREEVLVKLKEHELLHEMDEESMLLWTIKRERS